MPSLLCLAAIAGATSGALTPPAPAALKLHLRSRVETFKGSGQWDEVTISKELPAAETAIIVCDMWDKHWCASATRRCGELARKMAPVLDAARKKGVLIIHAPSECMDAYKDTPQRKRMMEATQTALPAPITIAEPALPIDDSDGGCDDQPQCKNYKAWSREHPALTVAAEDGVTDKGAEVYSVLQQRGIKNLLVMGVHTNMCVLGRSFAIRQMTRWGVRCVLVRDLTDTMYNPRMRPFVPHEQGTDLVIQHIEKYWCPSVLSTDLLR